MSIVVIGGGIAGLSAAYEVATRGLPVTLLEAGDRLGGLIRTEHRDGFTIDAGPESVLVSKPAAVDLIAELGLGPRLMTSTPPRIAFVLKGRRLHPLPSPSILGIPTSWGALRGYDLLSWPARARLAWERFVPARRDGADESVAAFFRRRFGPATVDLIAQPLMGGIHAGDIETLSLPSLFPRLAEAEARGGILRSAGGAAAPAAGQGLFRSLVGGMSELVEAIAARLPPGSVRLDSPATAIGRTATGWRIVTPGAALDTTTVIVAVPARVAAPLLTPVDAAIAGHCARVPYVSTASVALAFRRDQVAHPLAGSGFVVARTHSDVRLTACTWVSSKWAHRAPPGMVLLRAFFGGLHDPGAVDLDDAALVGEALRDLTPLLGISGAPSVTLVARWRQAGAQHDVGHRARMADIDARLDRLPGLFVTGSGFRSIGIPDCVADGRAVGAQAAALG